MRFTLLLILTFLCSIIIGIFSYQTYQRYSSKDMSIIMGFYNAEPYLAKALDSILSQKNPNFEVILINDGSKDKSYEIATAFAAKDKRVRLYTQKNKGIAAVRAKGLDLARGEYIWFIDSDDWIKPGAIEKVFQHAKQLNLDMLAIQALTYLETTKTFKKDSLYHFLWKPKNFKKPILTYLDLPPNKSWLFADSMTLTIYKKSFLDEKKIKFKPGFIFEDHYFFIQAYYQATRIGYIEEELYLRRRHPQSLTFRSENRFGDRITIKHISLEKIVQMNVPPSYISPIAIVDFRYLTNIYQRLPQTRQAEIFPKLKAFVQLLDKLGPAYHSQKTQEDPLFQFFLKEESFKPF